MQFEAKPRFYKRPIFETDFDRLYDCLGFSKTAYPSAKSRQRMGRKAKRQPYPIYKDNVDRVMYIRVGARRAVIQKFYRVFVDGEYTHTEFDCADYI